MAKPDIPFVEFPSISRWNRDVIVSEKLDGANGQIYVNDTGDQVFAGTRSLWVEPGEDNDGFAAWVQANKEELLKLGPGSHFGEWWGRGVRRDYGLKEKRFSLFNVARWTEERPACCHVVPVLWRGKMDDLDTDAILTKLATEGSVASPGYMKPEGIVIFHVPSQSLFKKTLDKHDAHKGATVTPI